MLDSPLMTKRTWIWRRSPPPARFSGVTLLAGAVLVLLPALAWLQYSWLDQIADSDRERRARTLQTAAVQLTQDFDAEIGRAVFALQIDASSVDQGDWSAFAQKYQVWTASAASPRIVKSIYFAHAPEDTRDAAPPPLRIWDTQTHTFDETPWPDDLASVRTRFVHENIAVIDLPMPGERRPANGSRVARTPMQRMLLPPTATGDDQSIVMPVIRVSAPGSDGRSDVTLLGFTILRFDLDALGTDLLPPLVRKHFYDEDGETEFAIAVVSRDRDGQVIFESQAGAAATASASPDATAALLGPRMGQLMFMARAAEGRRVFGTGPAPPPPPPPPMPGPGEVVVNVIETKRDDGSGVSVQRATLTGDGQWRLVAKHRAGSLEAAVAAARTRNFALSSGILVLLAAAIGLIVVSARRADRLARQQLEFVAAVSHELRTPVSVIGAAAGNLADGVVDEPGRVKRYGATIQTEARRLGETVERVLQLAGIAAGQAAAAPAALSVPALVEDAVAATRQESDAAGVTVEVDVADELRHAPTGPHGVQRVVGDAAALRSAIQNLISNAIKYGGDARWVRVSARSLTHKATRITVEDRGLGIAAEDRKHIFEPFYRGREAVSRQIQGSGLGLHLVQRIVEAHGGTVSVRSEAGRGSIFTVDLPGVHEIIVRKPVSLVRRLARLT
jgi:signal transduction histidine kinase